MILCELAFPNVPGNLKQVQLKLRNLFSRADETKAITHLGLMIARHFIESGQDENYRVVIRVNDFPIGTGEVEVKTKTDEIVIMTIKKEVKNDNSSRF